MCPLPAPAVQEKRDRVILQPGRYRAQCVCLCDIGLQEGTKYQSDEKEIKHQIWVRWETESGQFVQNYYKFSMHDKARLAIDISTWMFGGDWTSERRKDWDLFQLVGEFCELKTDLTPSGNPKVVGVFGPKGEDFPTKHPLVAYANGKFEKGSMQDIPPWVRDAIANPAVPGSGGGDEDELGF